MNCIVIQTERWFAFGLFTGQALHELGKEKTSQKQASDNTQQFLKSLGSIETKLTEQINYLTQVSTGQPHEGSGYASIKVLQMAWHRMQHARSRVRDLEDAKTVYMQVASRQQQNCLPASTSVAATSNGTAIAGPATTTISNAATTSSPSPATSQKNTEKI